jgi:hypothetical protein
VNVEAMVLLSAVAGFLFVFGCFGVPCIVSLRLKHHPVLADQLKEYVKAMNIHFIPRGVQWKFHQRHGIEYVSN